MDLQEGINRFEVKMVSNSKCNKFPVRLLLEQISITLSVHTDRKSRTLDQFESLGEF